MRRVFLTAILLMSAFSFASAQDSRQEINPVCNLYFGGVASIEDELGESELSSVMRRLITEMQISRHNRNMQRYDRSQRRSGDPLFAHGTDPRYSFDNQELIYRRDDMVPAVEMAVKRGLQGIHRLKLYDGSGPAEPGINDFKIYGVVTFVGTLVPPKPKEPDQRPKENSNRVVLTLSLMNLGTGEVLDTREFQAQHTTSSYSHSDQDALEDAIDAIGEQVFRYLWTAFPIVGEVLDGQSNRKGKLQELNLGLGSLDGVYGGQYFNVIRQGTLSGRATYQKIGSVRVTDVMGPEISVAKITDGRNDIQAALNAGEQLTVESR